MPDKEVAEEKRDFQLRVLTDANGKKVAEKLFETYMRREDSGYHRFPEWLLALDRLLSEFGGQATEGNGPKLCDDEDDPDLDPSDPDAFEFDEISSFADSLVAGVRKKRSNIA